MIGKATVARFAYLALAIGAPAPIWAAWWSTGTDVKSMCEKGDHGKWYNGAHGGISGWCYNTDRTWTTRGSANHYIMNVRMDRSLYIDPPRNKICIGSWTSPNGNTVGKEFVCRSELSH